MNPFDDLQVPPIGDLCPVCGIRSSHDAPVGMAIRWCELRQLGSDEDWRRRQQRYAAQGCYVTKDLK